MAYTIKNISKAPRGIHTTDRGLVWLKPGKVRSFETDDIAALRASGNFEIAEDDAELPAVPAKLAEKVAARTAPKAPAPKRTAARKRTTRRKKATP